LNIVGNADIDSKQKPNIFLNDALSVGQMEIPEPRNIALRVAENITRGEQNFAVGISLGIIK